MPPWIDWQTPSTHERATPPWHGGLRNSAFGPHASNGCRRAATILRYLGSIAEVVSAFVPILRRFIRY